MDINQAVKILNENKYLYKHHLFGHEMDVVWVINERTGHEPNILLRESGMWLGRKSIDQFTAIAVAEKYVKDSIKE